MKAEVSLQREELNRYLLKRPTRAYVEEKFAGVVSVPLARRTRAIVTLELEGYKRPITIAYHLPKDEETGGTLEIESRYKTMLERDYPDLWSWARHRACEAILARRNGDKEHVRVSARKRASKKLIEQQADT